MTIITKSLPKQKMIELLHIPENKEFRFVLSEYTVEDADKFVHNMRVELSRMRSVVISKGRKKKPFKVLLVSITDLGAGNIEIKLIKTMTKSGEVEEAVDKEFDLLAGGRVVNE